MIDQIEITLTRRDQLLLATLTTPYLPEHLMEAAAELNARLEAAFRDREEKEAIEADVYGKCERGASQCTGHGEELHTCPFQSEIHDDDRECNCCTECTYDCAMDI